MLYKVALLLLAGFGFLVMTSSDTGEDATTTCTCGTLIGIEFSPTVPGDNKLVTGQTQADCFAWWEFIALNWPVDANTSFGQPGDTEPVQWETYMTREVLLNQNGTKPPAWGSSQKAPDNKMALLADHPAGTKLLFHSSKFNSDVEIIDETGQAFPNNAPNWLGAQNGTNIWYEVLVNEDEYNYIVDNAFYNADSQYVYVAAGNRIDLPMGNSIQVGAMEIKASWMEVTDPENAEKWNTYKLSKAVLVDPGTGNPRPAIVALIGLHIIHKTESQPTWFWATFEHVDNVKDSEDHTGPWNLYNPDCVTQEVNVPAACGQNTNKADSTYTIDCTANAQPTYYLCPAAGPVPMQVSREIPIDNDAQAVNDKLQAFIQEHYPGSVWSNYQLINMIWSTTPQNIQPNTVPQGLKAMQPLIPMANTTSETFIQQTTCYSCHQFAGIAPTSGDPNPKFASDFSFVFEFAKSQK